MLTTIATTGDRFADFRPYVASIDDDGLVAFQAALAGGGDGVFVGDGETCTAVAEVEAGPSATFVSHPAIAPGRVLSVYIDLGAGGSALLRTDGATAVVLADSLDERGELAAIGPLGPTTNAAGAVAFRADLKDGAHGVFVGAEPGALVRVADTRGELAAFEGLPVITADGAVVYRATRRDGRQGLYRWIPDGRSEPLVETGERFAELGRFPSVADDGTVAFAATAPDGTGGVYTLHRGALATVVDTRGAFASVRGALTRGRDAAPVVFATPRGGGLGIFVGPEPVRDHVLAVGDALAGSTITAFALNPVSINRRGQLAIRVELADGRQQILRT